MSCTLCQNRKEKRFCAVLHDRICASCCGAQREQTLDCPSDCPYLRQAQGHDRFRPELLEDERWFADIEVGEDFLDTQAGLLDDLLDNIALRAAGDGSLRDRDVIAVLAELTRSLQTRVNFGLHYEPTRPSLAQQALIEELREILMDHDIDSDEVSGGIGSTNLRDGDALKALVFLLRLALDRSSGRPLSRRFLNYVQAEFPNHQGNQPAHIIVP